MFELTLGLMASSGEREKEWLKRVGTPARLERQSLIAVADAIKTFSRG